MVTEAVASRFLEVVVEDGDLASAIALLRKKTYSLRRDLKWRNEAGPKPSVRKRMKRQRAKIAAERHARRERSRGEDERMWSAVRDAASRR